MLLLLSLCSHSCLELCADFNHVTTRLDEAFNHTVIDPYYNHFYKCPHDGIADVTCKGDFPMRSADTIRRRPVSDVSIQDILFYMSYSAKSKGARSGGLALLDWWMAYFGRPQANVTFVIVADSCPDSDSDSCDDTAQHFLDALSVNHTYLDLSIVRALRSGDNGYSRLACKMVTGMIKIYRQYPDKIFYFKLDDDSVIFPHRLLRFIRTLDTAVPRTYPIYFGTVLNDHKPYNLCGGAGIGFPSPSCQIDANNSAGCTRLCYAQGGAGYGFNNLAFSTFLYNRSHTDWPCRADMDLEVSPSPLCRSPPAF